MNQEQREKLLKLLGKLSRLRNSMLVTVPRKKWQRLSNQVSDTEQEIIDLFEAVGGDADV